MSANIIASAIASQLSNTQIDGRQSRAIRTAAKRITAQIYRAISQHPEPAGRAQLLQYALNGLAPGLSERVAPVVEQLLANGVRSRRAVVRAIERELARAMHTTALSRVAQRYGAAAARVSAAYGLAGLGSNGKSGSMPVGGAAAASRPRMSGEDIANIIGGSVRAAGELTTMIGNTVVAARQGRQVAPAAPIVPPPLTAAAPVETTQAVPAAPAYTPPAPAPTPMPWGWIVGGAAAVAAVGGGVWYLNKQKSQPARRAA